MGAGQGATFSSAWSPGWPSVASTSCLGHPQSRNNFLPLRWVALRTELNSEATKWVALGAPTRAG